MDVLTYKNALSFQKPIIKTQVEYCKDKAKSKEVQQLSGAHTMDANCLITCTGILHPTSSMWLINIL
ncbi:hypothetical protein SAMN05192534_12912 [Alteribacillus persepolensis]|uniref:Uncharacterized protein n=1 Tax=Alteribacillus persepolensis TaxID=568899 RepID=A0A1G8J4U7_9BACI|nr:hypothetical protein SAMN05192534_12912 [Alteribacillus persepolensis]